MLQSGSRLLQSWPLLQQILLILLSRLTVAHSSEPQPTAQTGSSASPSLSHRPYFNFGPVHRPPWLTCQTDRVGNLRFRLPEQLDPYTGQYNATAYGLSCPQQATALSESILSELPEGTLEALESVLGTESPADGEDCEQALATMWREILTIDVGLNLNVIAPANVSPGTKLPVVVVCIL